MNFFVPGDGLTHGLRGAAREGANGPYIFTTLVHSNTTARRESGGSGGCVGRARSDTHAHECGMAHTDLTSELTPCGLW
jgi:hypothetical protein